MSNLVPTVTPANNALGIAIGFQPTAIFEQSMDAGSISAGSCFIVEISKHEANDLDTYLSNASIQDVLPSKVESQRINLLDEDLYTGLDFGTDGDSGEKYRTKIYLKPDNLLKPNTTYAAILSKDLSLLSVFDPEPNGGNSGTGELLSQGVYSGLTSDTYTITIASSGNKNTAKYMWTRSSDGHTSVSLEARGRYIDIDRGLKLKFEDGNYVIGDSFVVRVIPKDKQDEIYSWTFSTGSGDYQTPDDERSGSLLNLPVIGNASASGEGLFVTKVEPTNGQSLVKIPRKANVLIGDVLVVTKSYTSSFNNYTIETIDGAVAGAEVVTIVGSDISVTIQDGESTAQQIVNALNASGLVNVDFEASTVSANTKQAIQSKRKFSKGVDQVPIIITFNKDLNPASITDKVKILARPVYPAGVSEELSFSTSVSGKQLTITLEERS